MTVVQGSQYGAGSGPGLSGHSSDCPDAHCLPRVVVNDAPISQWLSKVDLNVIIAFITTSERSGEGKHSVVVSYLTESFFRSLLVDQHHSIDG